MVWRKKPRGKNLGDLGCGLSFPRWTSGSSHFLDPEVPRWCNQGLRQGTSAPNFCCPFKDTLPSTKPSVVLPVFLRRKQCFGGVSIFPQQKEGEMGWEWGRGFGEGGSRCCLIPWHWSLCLPPAFSWRCLSRAKREDLSLKPHVNTFQRENYVNMKH